jgi:antitoxin HicB
MTDKLEYAVLLRPIEVSDGAGFEVVVPDLPGCMSDGDTYQEALTNVLDAIESWKEASEELGRPIPAPGSSLGQWRQRVPKTLHETLKHVAAQEGVSLNQLVTALLAQAVGSRLGSQIGA